MTGNLSFARVEPVAEVDTCRGKSTAIKLRHPDTCHIRDFSGSLRLSAPLTHIRGEGSGGPLASSIGCIKVLSLRVSMATLSLYPDLLEYRSC